MYSRSVTPLSTTILQRYTSSILYQGPISRKSYRELSVLACSPSQPRLSSLFCGYQLGSESASLPSSHSSSSSQVHANSRSIMTDSRPTLWVLNDNEGVLASSAGVDGLRELANVKIFTNEDSPLDQPAKVRDEVQMLFTIRERTKLSRDFLSHFPALELILQSGGHAYHIDTASARERGIAVALGRHVTAPLHSVPELTFALAINTLRDIPRAHAQLQGGTAWPSALGKTLGGKQLGILGLGRHGKNIARIADAFGMKVVAWDRRMDNPEASGIQDKAGALSFTPDQDCPDDVTRLPLQELLSTSDVVSIHLRLSPESTHLFHAERLAQMKKGSILINTSRGKIIDESALIQALSDPAHPLAGAGLDVFEVEPLPADSPLRSLPNVTMTPHIGWTVEEVLQNFAAIASKQLRAYLSGKLSKGELLDPDVTGGHKSAFQGAGFTE